ncbi:hypothetical protein [Halalkalibacter nanhaiisediminis]|uniref:Gas vesicle protein n=1 Tax=Halalkalibacter nanhaiisediminis TaxID=688079 RepID=A0A562QCG6_9BACI|nr:hypothetical protein [Halalkalibacter nanhaiisediminis]TWI54442.1 hypothetical protein IQ10_02994 [Halalkalibacter nanhaiisediminis]
MDKKCNTVCKGLWIGGAVALSIVLANKERRTMLVTELKRAKDGTSEVLGFIRDNREQIFEQVRSTASEVSNVIRDISEDIRQIGETAAHLKESSEEIVKATKDAATEMKNLKQN